jgi:hypothetical protein
MNLEFDTLETTTLVAPTAKKVKIPEDLIWEVLDGKPLYRRGYMDVVSQLKTKEEIMGTSSYQALITTYLSKLLARQLDDDTYDYLISEPGVHFKRKDNISNDIAIFDLLPAEKISKKYLNIPAKIVIEIDIDIDSSCMPDVEYMEKKTRKMLDFGTEKVIWILTNNRTVMVATPNSDWTTVGWDTDVEILEGISFNIHNYLVKRGIDIE